MLQPDELIARDENARSRALDVGASILCSAPAGSGKTELLVQRGLACLATANYPEEVLLLTFTAKAATEIRERLVAALESAKGPEPDIPHRRRTWRLAKAVAERDVVLGWNVSRNPGRLRAMTLDALNKLIAEQAPIASGMGGGTRVEPDPSSIYRDAALELINAINSVKSEQEREALTSVLLLAQNQCEKLVTVLSEMLAKRDQWLGLVVSGDHFDAVTVVRPIIESRLARAAAMFPQNVCESLLQAGHGSGKLDSDVLEWPGSRAEDLPVWISLADMLLTQGGALRARLDSKAFPAKAEHTVSMKSALTAINELPQVSLLIESLKEIRSLPTLECLEPVQKLCEQVGVTLTWLAAHLNLAFIRAGGIDFQEVARRALDALGDESGTSPLMERLDYRIRHILLDEAQDTSSAQYEFLSALTLGWEHGDGRSLFIVGDPQQSIYGFREAEVRLFMEMWKSRLFGLLPLEPVTLSRNFRSDSAIIDWCNQTFSRVFPTVADVYNGSVTHTPSFSMRGDQSGSVSVYWFRGAAEDDEAAKVVSVVREALRKNPGKSIAILARNRRHVLETMTAMKVAGIRAACKDIDPLSETPAVRDVVGLIRALWHDHDRVSWAIFLRAPFVGLSYADLLSVTRGRTNGSWLEAIRGRVDLDDAEISQEGRVRLRRLLGVLDAALADADLVSDLHDLSTAVWLGLGGPACVTPSEFEDVRSTFRLLRERLSGGQLTDLRGFLVALDGLYAVGEAGFVQIMTMHGAKGLEFDTVLLVGLGRKGRSDDKPLLAYRHTNEGTLMVPNPGYRSGEGHQRLFQLVQNLNVQAGAYERLRLLYVACTRARDHLHLFCTVENSKNPHPRSGSLLFSLWPALGSTVDPQTIPISSPHRRHSDLQCPVVPRLRLDWESPRASPAYVPPITRTMRPSELAVRGELDQLAEETGIVERLIGTAYHETVTFLLDRSLVERFDSMLDRIVLPMRSGLRRRGMPEPELDRAVERVLNLVRMTLSCKDGQKIIRRRDEEGNEYRLTGFIDGEWISAVIDRYYVEDGTCWVIDYKTGGDVPEDRDLDRFLDAEVERYQPQVWRYMNLMHEARGMPVRGGLFFAAAGRFVEV